MTAVFWLALGLLVLCGGQAVIWYHQLRETRRMRLAHEVLVTEVLDLRAHTVRLGESVPLNVALQSILRQELTHFHTPTIDRLLAKLGPPFLLTASEEHALLAAMKQREQDMGDQMSDSEREAAQLLPLIMRRIKRDQATPTPNTVVAFQVVSMTTPPREEGR